ncbi:unnamed protein product [Ranitomeya imitator]|uniref:Gamma tubulin complex component C-terminal domain-containing protein n=1 Tax=Ranitomeya imitator TaxID=111125 RepID=A0ABN9KSD2_9NEOB|nr:unnamed protein product [Ranitomeya imitator]
MHSEHFEPPGYISVIKIHSGTNLPAGRFGRRTAHAPAILEDGGAQERRRTVPGRPDRAILNRMIPNMAGFESTINNFDTNFSTHLMDLLDKLSMYSTNDCEHSMINIIYRLDFNGFYTEHLKRLSAERSQKSPPRTDPIRQSITTQ